MKKNKLYYLYYFIICNLIFTGCKHDTYLLSETKEVDYSVNTDRVIEGESVDIDQIGLQRIFITDNYLVLFANDPKGMVKVYDMESLTPLGSFCPEGRSSTELLNPDWTSVQIKKEKGTICLYVNNFNGETKVVDISKSVAEKKTVIDNKYNTIDAYKGRSLYLTDNHWLEFENVSYDDPRDHLYYPPHFYVRRNEKREEIPLFGDIIKPEIPSLTTNLYSGAMSLKPDNTKCVFAMTLLNYLHIIDIQNKTVSSIHQVDGGSFNGPTTVNYYMNTPLAFFDAVSTDTHILTLSYDQSNNSIEQDGIQVPSLKIFDWEGNYITGAKLDTFIRWFAYDETSNCIYGMMDEKIIKYDISGLIE